MKTGNFSGRTGKISYVSYVTYIVTLADFVVNDLMRSRALRASPGGASFPPLRAETNVRTYYRGRGITGSGIHLPLALSKVCV